MPTVTIGENTGNTYSGTVDTLLRQIEATTNFGAGVTFHVAKYQAADHNHAVIAFPGLSNIPSTATVSAVTMYLWPTFTNSPTFDIAFRRVLRNWVEAEATWNIWSTSNNWTTAGCLSDGNDRVAATSALITSADSGTGAYQSYASAGMVTDVQNWVNGTNPNYGWHLMQNDAGETTQLRTFHSSEGTDTRRPYLEVTYTAVVSSPTDGILWVRPSGFA